MRLRPVLLALGASSALLAGACDARGSTSVLLITLDTTRADALGAYGHEPSVTPNLDRLAREGVLFTRAFTVAPLTLPAHASMLTGLFPPRHGVRDNGLVPLPSSATTLAERAREAGFETAAFLGSVVLDQGFGLEQGFERYEAPARRFYNAEMGYAERSSADTATLATQWLEGRERARPFFAWVHLWDAHGPYEPAPNLLERAGGNPYLGEVAGDDLAVGRLLAALKKNELLDDTLVIVVADHGEAFLEHDELSHGAYVWNTTLRVPLLLRLPGGGRAGERVDGIASVVDVFPTALAAMGLAGGADALDGQDLLADEPGAGRGAYFESYYGYFSYGWHPLTGWLDRAGKYIHSSKPLFFELDADAMEQHDLFAERREALRAYQDRVAAVGASPALARDAEGVDPELRAALQAVGYAAAANEGANVPPTLAYLELASPHERAQEQLEFQKAQGMIAAEKYADAEPILNRLVRDNPGNRSAWDRLALCRLRLGHARQAIEPLERVLAHGPGHADTWTYLGTCRLATGDDEKALAAFTRALEIDPNHVHALQGLIGIMEGAGMREQAAPFRARFEAVQSRP